ncbi:MAG TPA: hypothetical protein VF331_28255 [Polyangiales bacterium]
MDIILAPDVYVNASVALGSPPEQVVRRVLGKHKGESKTTEWILARVRQMLRAIPAFKGDAVDEQVNLIKGLVQVVPTPQEIGADHWEEALVAAAKAAGAKRVVTDHPDLLQMESSDGIEFMSTEAWMIEVTTPPPAPPGRAG